MEIQVVQRNGLGHVILCDEADAELVRAHTWHVVRTGVSDLFYAVTQVRVPRGRQRQVKLYMHVMLMGELGVDHINHNGLDNRRSNLRSATNGQNQANRLFGYGVSRYKGVAWNKTARKWQAQLGVEGRRRYLGVFEVEETAARTYDAAARETWGEFAKLNFPEE